MLPIIRRNVRWEIIQIIIGMIFCDEAVRLFLVPLVISFVLFINFGFDIEELIPWVSARALTWSSLLENQERLV